MNDNIFQVQRLGGTFCAQTRQDTKISPRLSLHILPPLSPPHPRFPLSHPTLTLRHECVHNFQTGSVKCTNCNCSWGAGIRTRLWLGDKGGVGEGRAKWEGVQRYWGRQARIVGSQVCGVCGGVVDCRLMPDMVGSSAEGNYSGWNRYSRQVQWTLDVEATRH